MRQTPTRKLGRYEYTLENVAKVYRTPYWLIVGGGPEPPWRKRPIWRLRALWWRYRDG